MLLLSTSGREPPSKSPNESEIDYQRIFVRFVARLEELSEEEMVEKSDGEGEVSAGSDALNSQDDGGGSGRSRAPSPTSSCASVLAKQVAGLGLSTPLQVTDPLPAVQDAAPEGAPEPKSPYPEPPATSGSDPGLGGHAALRHIVASEVVRHQQKQKAKYHSKRMGAGRSRGSKAKQDTRIKLDKGEYVF